MYISAAGKFFLMLVGCCLNTFKGCKVKHTQYNVFQQAFEGRQTKSKQNKRLTDNIKPVNTKKTRDRQIEAGEEIYIRKFQAPNA